ncbi:MAG TPA: uridine diphosphate-N-acetylglucosamine-binding protein YvcK [Gammaproteobacteria bacterium]
MMLESTLDYAVGNRLGDAEFLEARSTPLRITALGGGTGLAALLQGLRVMHFPVGMRDASDQDRLTAIVTVADDGGSSGALRRGYNILAPGDIRNCLLALSDADPTLQELFNFRFDSKLGGHSLGNLMLTALALLEKDFGRAVERAGRLLDIRGRVLPATLDDVQLLAEFADGSCSMGESCITAAGRRIKRVSLVPRHIQALPQAVHAIAGSHLVVLGPGSLYTSLIPVLLVKGIAEAIADSGAKVVVVMNLMTEPGETDGYGAADVVNALRDHAPELPIHAVLFNSTRPSGEQLRRYAAEGSEPITADSVFIKALGCRALKCDLLGDGPMVRHEPCKLAKALLNLALEET